MLCKCEKCGKVRDGDKYFYTYRNGEKTKQCKDCLTMFINNWDPETYLWLLKEMDVPYIECEWTSIRDKAYAKNPNLNGMSVFGKYLSKMKLKQWKDYRWADTEKLKEEREIKEEFKAAAREEIDANLKKQLEEGIINEHQYMTLASTPAQEKERAAAPSMPSGTRKLFREEELLSADDIPDLGSELTKDDRIYLAMKWGRLYTPSEWVELERIYTEMTKSFDIQDADTIQTLILICKTNLKANQALDQGDTEGFQKLSRTLESLRKSAKFTAAQKKEEKDNFVDCVGNLVAYCEREGGSIPKYEITVPNDIIDTVINDLKSYTKNLIYEDSALAQQIEDYLTQRQILERRKAEKQENKGKEEDLELDDSDLVEYYKQREEERQKDEQLLQGFDENEDNYNVEEEE